MNFKNLITWLPIMAALIGSLYTGINVVSKMNNTLEAHTIAISEMTSTLKSIDEKYEIEIKNLTQKYTEAREELFQEMTRVWTDVNRNDANLDAMNQSYYKLDDAIRQFGYDLKDLKRELEGGY
jgi:DNA repair ATPase RecN|tara:strand:- start:128 stop:499 length:372 start_codon:yes stop_codon:yes gene_type:complete